MRLLCITVFAIALSGCGRQTAIDGAGERARLQDGAKIELRNGNNESIGRLTVTIDGAGVARFSGDLRGLPPGTHGFHIHEIGRCDAPGFNSAGAHFNPTGQAHGGPDQGEAHAGDLGNIVVDSNGRVSIDVVAKHLNLRANGSNSLYDSDGSSVVVHADPDDFKTQPSGNAGARIACGVLTR
jgi:Cu-Zn family superoxide dismutase